VVKVGLSPTARHGPVILAGAQEGAENAARPRRVALTPYPAIAPLLGAAVRAPAAGGAEVMTVADLGHSSIKTARAERRGTELIRFKILDGCLANRMTALQGRLCAAPAPRRPWSSFTTEPRLPLSPAR